MQLPQLFWKMYLKLKEFSRVQYLCLPYCMQWFYCLTSLPVPQRSTAATVAGTGQQMFSHAADLISGSTAPFSRRLSVLGWGCYTPWAGQAPALLPVVLGHVVCQPVHFGFPALSQGFIKLQSEVLQCLLISFPKGQGVLQARDTSQCSTEQFTAQPGRCLFIRSYSIEWGME